MNIKLIFGSLAVMVALLPFIFYFYGIAKGKVKPHILSWFTWSLITGIGFFVSMLSGGGTGAWILGLNSFLCLGVAISSLFRGEKQITTLDWVSFAGAIVLTIFYFMTKNAIWTAVFAVLIDSLGFIPTFRKSFTKPYEEQYFMYACSSIGFLLSIFALTTYNFPTLFYPSVLIVTNFSFVVFLYLRRRAI